MKTSRNCLFVGALLLTPVLGAFFGCREAKPIPVPTPVESQKPQVRVNPQQTDPTAEDYPAPELPRAAVHLKDAYGGTHVVDAEVVATTPMRNRGLMWRQSLAAGKGMLFIFSEDSVHSFWMRNTLIPLDMLFIDKAGRVVGIVENAVPQSLVSRGVGEPSRYVLEVPGGWSKEKGLVAGARASFRGIENIVAQ